jgi:hypothetical protein
MSFPQPSNRLYLDPVGQGVFRLRLSFVYQLDAEMLLEIPAGFETDLASVPRWVRWLIVRRGTHAAGVVHDFIYREQRLPYWSKGARHVARFESLQSRHTADQLFYEMLRQAKVGAFRARLMYLAVSLFGGKAWERSRRV